MILSSDSCSLVVMILVGRTRRQMMYVAVRSLVCLFAVAFRVTISASAMVFRRCVSIIDSCSMRAPVWIRWRVWMCRTFLELDSKSSIA